MMMIMKKIQPTLTPMDLKAFQASTNSSPGRIRRNRAIMVAIRAIRNFAKLLIVDFFTVKIFL